MQDYFDSWFTHLNKLWFFAGFVPPVSGEEEKEMEIEEESEEKNETSDSFKYKKVNLKIEALFFKKINEIRSMISFIYLCII